MLLMLFVYLPGIKCRLYALNVTYFRILKLGTTEKHICHCYDLKIYTY